MTHCSDPVLKRLARAMVNAAIHGGAIVRAKNCNDCGAESAVALQGHHEDYGRPLKVLWLCRRCHGKRHGGPRPFSHRVAGGIKTAIVPRRTHTALKLASVRTGITIPRLIKELVDRFLPRVTK